MDFECEVVRTSQSKLVSNDNQYVIVLRTDNPLIMDLGKLPGTTLFKGRLDIARGSTERVNDLGDFE